MSFQRCTHKPQGAGLKRSAHPYYTETWIKIKCCIRNGPKLNLDDLECSRLILQLITEVFFSLENNDNICMMSTNWNYCVCPAKPLKVHAKSLAAIAV